MLIGIEIELHSERKTIYDIAKAEWLNFQTFKMKDWLKVKMSVEYYPNTIEYNFEPKMFSWKYIKQVAEFMQKQIDKYGLRLYAKSPSFVWTHIHIFDLKYRKLKGTELLETTMSEIDKVFDWLHSQSKKRLALSHQLWWNYIYNNFNKYTEVAADYWWSMTYQSMTATRVKCNPYIVSNRSNKWKPRSVEIRIIPNEFLFNNKLILLLAKINKWDYTSVNINTMLGEWLSRLR